MTLIECLVAVVVSSVLLSAVEMGLLAGNRFARISSVSRATRQNLRAAAAVLRGELQNLAAGSGDIVAMSDSAIELRGQRGMGIVCLAPAAGSIVLDDSLLSLARPINPSSDSAKIFAEGDPLVAADDRWVVVGIAAARSGSCGGGRSGMLVTISGVAADLADIRAGAPVRIFEIAEYRRYRDASGVWWFGVRNPSGAGWGSTSPIAGPLLPRIGLVITGLDAGLSPTTAPDSVRVVAAQLRLFDPTPLTGPGRPGFVPVSDSTLMRVALANP
jgi:type II secretory pathway pseudopilin PulG